MSSASSAAAAAPWADLLPELCGLVVDRLDPVSILRFPAACRGWAAACEESPRLRSGAPALLTSGLDPEGIEVVDAGSFRLHDVSAGGRSFLGEAAGLKGRTWIGGKDDWLVTTDYACNVELLNPVTGDRVPLPSFGTTQGAKLELPGYLHVSTGDRWHKILKITLCQTPAHPGGGYLAIALFSDGLLAFTAAGTKKCWTALKNHAAASRLDLSYMDAMVLKGKLFAVELLRARHVAARARRRQRRVTVLGGDRALFLGANYPFYITAPPGSEDLKANCVYVADTPSGYDAGIFDLKKTKGEDGFVERLACSLMADALRMPMWFRPTTHPRLVKDI
ncbi:uncharacterized protein C2845_PM15G23660 [Panicum miliaceum]|uniref:KIB1-4 beta-propeller domain-containing protein n=1 Tax=Panicum miliaceum TaxID=4540 RepID=A0A3L6Q5M5_PANMI|nr:uncharacterized protein C2845_PM15G23660 [Panicum miliaceum]